MKDLVLAGCGAVHLHLLRAWAGAPPPGVRLHVVAPQALAVDPARLWGHVAGHWPLEAASADLARLAAAAQGRWTAAAIRTLDAAQRRIVLSDGQTLAYDLLSLDAVAGVDRHRIAGAHAQGLFLRPLAAFVQLWPHVVALAGQRALHAVVIGGGRTGVALAMAVAHRLGGQGRVSLVSGRAGVLPRGTPALRRRVQEALRLRRITVLPEDAVELLEGEVALSNGARLTCDAPLLALGTVPPPWLADSGLQLGEEGLAATVASLQSSSHPEVIVPGELGLRADMPARGGRPRAERVAAVLDGNLRALLSGQRLRPCRLPRWPVQWLDCGDRRAIAGMGDWLLPGWLDGVAWRWGSRRGPAPRGTRSGA